MKSRNGFSGRPLLGQLTVALVILGVLAVGRTVFLPIALAALAATLLGPIVSRWEGTVGRPAASFAAVSLMVMLVLGCLVFAGAQVAAIARELPDHSANVSRKLGELRLRNNATLASLDDTVRDLARQLEEVPLAAPLVRVVPPVDSIAIRLAPVGVILEEVVTALLVVTLIFFLLLHAQTVNDKIRRLFGRANVAATSGALRKASQRIGRYLLLQSIANTGAGVLVAGALFALGVPHAALFGLLTAILRFVPYIGAAFAAVLPTLLAFAVSPDWLLPMTAFAAILSIDLILGLVLEPLWFGKHMGVSPIVLPLSAMVWTWIWGPIGLLLATPITVSLQVIGETVPSLGFLDVIFGVGSQLDPHLRFMGRLLAPNKEAAAELAESLEAELGLVALYDHVLTPALDELDAARAEGRIDPETALEALAATRAIIASPARFALQPPGARVVVASPGAADEPRALMTAQVLRSLGHEVSVLGPEGATDGSSMLPPPSLAQVLVLSFASEGQSEAARALVARVREERPRLGIIVVGRGFTPTIAHLQELGCALAQDFAALPNLLPRLVARASRSDQLAFARNRRRAADPRLLTTHPVESAHALSTGAGPGEATRPL